MLISLSIENEMSMPCTQRAVRRRDRAVLDHHAAAPHVDAVEARRRRCGRCRASRAARRAMSMPFSPPTTVTLRSVTWFARIRMPPLHDAADERLRVADHERALHVAVQVDGRRPHRVRGAEPAERRSPRPRPRVSAPAGPARRRPRAYSRRRRGKSACPKSCAPTQPIAYSPSAQPSGAISPSQRIAA